MNLSTTDYDIPGQGRSFPETISPDPALIFRDRFARFEALAHGHTLSGWLSFLGRITESQHRQLADYPALSLPDDDCLAFSRKRSLPPLPAASWPRDPVWRQTLARLIGDIMPHAPAPAQAILARLRALDNASLETIADQILRLELNGRHAEYFPFLAAALQVHWTALAAALGPEKLTRLDAPGLCPCCGFLPVGSVVRTEGDIPHLRYLHCGLCNTQWHLVRVTCAACGESGRGIAYRYIDGSDGAVRAETCNICKSYLKIIYRQKSPAADPVADDLATLPIDLLLEEEGYNRMSPNLLFAHSS